MQELLIPGEVAKLLKKQKYQIVGRHSAVKKCRWLHNSLVQNRHCYKQEWYNIKSHRCLQMTPTVIYCTNRCLSCWRVEPGDIKSHRCLQMTPTVIYCTNRCLSCWRVEPGDHGYEWDQLTIRNLEVNSPEEIVEGCLNADSSLPAIPRFHGISGERPWSRNTLL